MYGGCNANPVNEVWYTYVSSGAQNDYTITSNGITDIEIMIDIDGCGNGTFEICATETGTNTLTQGWGVPTGMQVWVMIASNGGTEGDFQLCINSADPSPGNGNTCGGAIPLCDASLTYNTPDIGVLQSSGNVPPCFGSPPSQDIWYQFTVTQTGLLEWEAIPIGVGIELDWALYDITNGCPGTLEACNYNYAGNSSASAGMITGVSCATCPTSGPPGTPCGEYCDPATVTAGNTYAIQIDNYTGTPNTGLDFNFGPGMTALIAPDANFTLNPSGITCGTNVTVNVADASLGVPDWTFGNGNTFTGTNPPAQTYTVPGVYAITATITGACPSSHSEYVEIYGPLTAIAVSTNESCGACDGTASVTADGGDGIFSYMWNTTATTPSITGLCSGSYTVTVSNATCGTQVIETVVVGSGGVLPFTTSNTNAACTGDSTGTASITVQSGNTPYTYLWSNGQTSSTAVGLPVGTYSVTATDASGCDTITTIIVSDPPPIIIDASAVTIANASCSGADGSIVGITASGGTGTLTYTWIDGLTNNVGTTADLSGIGTGSYTLIVNDANNCVATSGPYLVVATTATTVITTGTPTNCYQGCDATATATAGSGTPPYFYSWSTSPAQTAATSTGLCKGTYYVTVTDASCSPSGIELATNGDFSGGSTGFSSAYYFCNSGGCLGPEGGYGVGTSASFYNTGFTGVDNTTGSGNFMVINGSTTAGTNVWCQSLAVNPNTNYQLSTWLSSLNPSNPAVLQFTANGIAVGVTFNAPGGTGTWIQFSETWNSGNNASVTICITNQNTAGSGNDFGLDDISFQECVNSCPSVDSVIIAEPTALSVAPSITDALCFGACDGAASVTATDGTFPYTYAWSSLGNSSTETALCLGAYTVTVTDLNGCDTTIAVFIGEPTVLTLGGSMVAEKCGKADGEAVATAAGGAPPYSYLWDDVLMQTTQTASGLSAQTYNVVITDANGCTASIPFTIPEIAGPDIDSIVVTTLACAGDADAMATVSVSGLSPPFTYLWDDPGAQITSTASNLGAGTYSVTATDLYGCDTTQSITIVEPLPINISVSGTDTVCYGQTAPAELNTLTTGGQAPYTFTWDNGLPSDDSISMSPAPTVTTTYEVVVTDAGGCDDTTSMEIFVSPPLLANVGDTVICEGEQVNISVIASGGTNDNYTYTWSDGSITSSITLMPTTTDTFTVVVNDGCSGPVNAMAIVVVGPKPNALFTVACDPNKFYSQFTDASTVGMGSIVAWDWDFGDATTSTVQNPSHDYLSSAQYTVSLTVTTDNQCSDTYYNTIQSSPTADFTAVPSETTTANPTIEFVDGSSPDVVSWSWAYGDNDSDLTTTPVFSPGSIISHTYDSSGIYAIVLYVTNAQGCIDSALGYVQILEEYILFAPNVFTPNGNATNDVFKIVGVGINPDRFELLVFDRWGDLIYQTRDYEAGWDGRANNGSLQAQSDVYIWVVNTVDPAQKKHQYVGHVTLFR
jgi:gliding motility-associated-like protein